MIGGDRKRMTLERHMYKGLPPPTRSCRASPLHESFKKTMNIIPNNRASLEKDIEDLQLQLQQERLMWMLFEKTIRRTSSLLSPGHRHFSCVVRTGPDRPVRPGNRSRPEIRSG
ncbi:unnamed protein product [Cuscuta epithymum]|uniref:Uncharacterized protein n=1 Tax=Cuscuta epithymum TaxID=186058 RepID=A0AAV0CYM9_9ASTE|nr:unnamed protein product [Cuscuta epithymum]